MSGGIARSAAGYQGLVAWALTTLVVVFILTSAVGSIVGGTLGAVTGAFSGAGNAVSSAIKTVAPAMTGSSDPTASIVDQMKGAANVEVTLDPRAKLFLKEGFRLTERESSVAGLVARRLAPFEVAEALRIVQGTVRNHLKSAMHKIGVSSQTQLAALVARYG